MIDLNDLILSVYEDIKLTAGAKPIRLNLQPIPSVMGDRDLIRQVIYNVLSNSVKFSQNRDEIQIDVTASETPSSVSVTVRDYGVGFDMQYAEKLGMLFETLHNGDEFEGSGVGLAIVRTVMERHNGQVRIESRLGEGCAVSLLFQK